MADLTITRNTTLPNSSSKADFHNLVDTATGTITNIVNADINSSAAIASSKLDLSSVGQKIVMSSKAIDEAQGSNIASASSIDLGAATGNYVVVTGTTGITSLGTVQAGVQRIVEFSGALTITHNATSLILPGGASITTAAGDVAIFISEGSGNWRCVSYTKANGTPLFYGGVTGSYKNLKIVRDSVTQVTVTADELTLDTGNKISSVSEAIAITTSGASGLDTGAEGSSRWYYIWIIRKSSDGTVNGLLSESSSAPTMPSGYDQKALVSAVYNNSSSDFVDFRQNNIIYSYASGQSAYSGAPSGTVTVDISSYVPSAISNYAFGTISCNTSGSFAVSNLSSYSYSQSSNQSNNVIPTGGASFNAKSQWAFPLLTENNLYVGNNSYGGVIYVEGFIINKL